MREQQTTAMSCPSHPPFWVGVVLLSIAGLACGCATRSVQEPIEVTAFRRDCSDGPIRGLIAEVLLDDPLVDMVVSAPVVPPLSEGDSILTGVDEWAESQGVTLAVNANFFSLMAPLPDGRRPGEVIGLSVSDGHIVSPARKFRGVGDPALLIIEGHKARISTAEGSIFPGVTEAVAGVGGSETDPDRGGLLVRASRNLGATCRVEPDKRHPRTAAGVSGDGRTLWLVTVDGRQPDWSVGMTLPELGDLMIELGAVDALNLDGGGSTSFWYMPAGAAAPTVNRPSDGKFRLVANQIGVRVSGERVRLEAADASWRD